MGFGSNACLFQRKSMISIIIMNQNIMTINENECRGSVGINGLLPEETILPKWA